VLALQGDWEAHLGVLRSLGHEAVPVRTAEQLARVDALILPGGESTAMLRLMEADDLDRRIRDRIADGMAVFATCAGVILLARNVAPEQPSLAVLDIDVERNAYGRQVHSTVAPIRLNSTLDGSTTLEGVFIRAPRVTRVGTGVEVLGWHGDDPVLLRQGAILAATFHPELTSDPRIHRIFCSHAVPLLTVSVGP